MALTDTISKLPNKRFSSAGAMFDPIKMRWLQGNTTQAASSVVFRDGYEDPTYMTFRVEFGGWGWSVLPKSALKGYEMQTSNGETVLSALNVNYQTYDQLPLGLLDMHFALNSNYNARGVNEYETSQILSYPKYAFNNQNYYNAVNWLLMRNEDQRAIYLKNFVEGLYELQHDHPYMFQKINGLNGLETVNTKSGARLGENGVDLTIECIEGLQLKLKSLFQMYRKAAWDDVWQRWVLPENMREFTMIVYVFERRTFHEATVRKGRTESYSSQTSNYDKDTDTTTVNITNITNIFSQDYSQPDLHIHDLNYDLPIYAYECSPCEFIIDNTLWGDSYDATFENETPEGTTIKVKVKNVQTFYKNRMMKNLQDTLVYDLLDAMDREMENVDFSGSGQIAMGNGYLKGTVNGAKAAYLDKRVFWEKDLMDKTRVLYGTDFYPSGIDTLTGQMFHTQISPKATDESYLKEVQQIQYQVGKTDQISLKTGLTAANISDQREENWWDTATVTGGLNFSSWKAFKNSLKNLLTTAQKQIRVSPGYSKSALSIYNNTLDFIDMTGSPAAEALSVATDLHIDPCYELFENAQLQTRGSSSWATDNELSMRWNEAEIDRDDLTNYDWSWATRDASLATDHIMDSEFNAVDPTERNSATDAPVKGGEIDRDEETNNDWSWATRDDNVSTDHVMDTAFNKVDPTERMSAIDSSVAGGNLDRDKLTNYDASWATKDSNNKHDHTMSSAFNKVDQTERQSAVDSSFDGGNIDRAKLTGYDASWATHDNSSTDHKSSTMLGVDQSERTMANTDVSVESARTLDQQEMHEQEGPRTLDDEQLNQVDSANRKILYADIDTLNERQLKKAKTPTIEDPRQIQSSELPEIEPAVEREHVVEGVDLPERQLPGMSAVDQLKPRTLAKPAFDEMDDARELSNNTLAEVDQSERVSQTAESVMDDVRQINNVDLNAVPEGDRETYYVETQVDEARDAMDMEFNEPDEQRQIDDMEMHQPSGARKPGTAQLRKVSGGRTLRKRNMKSVDQKQRAIKKKKLQTVSQSERETENMNISGNIYGEDDREMYMDQPEDNSLYFEERQLPEETYPTIEKAREMGVHVLNRAATIKLLSKATSKMNSEFAKIDQESQEIEDMTKKLLGQSKTLKAFKVSDSARNGISNSTMAVAKAFADESANTEEALAQRILTMQAALEDLTLDTVRELPEAQLSVVYDSPEQAKQEPIMLSMDAERELYNNALLYGIPKDDVRHMSVHAMLSLYEALINQGNRFNQLKNQGLFTYDQQLDRSFATDLDGGPRNQNLRPIDKTTRHVQSGEIQTQKLEERPLSQMEYQKIGGPRKKNEVDSTEMPTVEESKAEKKPRKKLGHQIDTKARKIQSGKHLNKPEQ